MFLSCTCFLRCTVSPNVDAWSKFTVCDDYRNQQEEQIEGSRPEWCIPSMIYSRDTPFWSGTLEMAAHLRHQPSGTFDLMAAHLRNQPSRTFDFIFLCKLKTEHLDNFVFIPCIPVNLLWTSRSFERESTYEVFSSLPNLKEIVRMCSDT